MAAFLSMSGREKVLAVLRSGGRWSAARIAEQTSLQVNTVEKWICLHRKERELTGKGDLIESGPAAGKGHFEYWIDYKPQTEDEKLLSEIKKILSGYPPECSEREKIIAQKNELEFKIKNNGEPNHGARMGHISDVDQIGQVLETQGV